MGDKIKHITLLILTILFISPLLCSALAGIVELISEMTSFSYSRSSESIVAIILLVLLIIGSWLVLRGKSIAILLLTIFSAVTSVISIMIFLFIDKDSYITIKLLYLLGLEYVKGPEGESEMFAVLLGFVYPIILLFSIISTLFCYKIYKKYYAK